VIPVGSEPWGVAVSPNGSKVYVGNQNSNDVSVIDTATNTVVATIPVGSFPAGIAVTPDGSKVYVANNVGSNTVSVIDTATNTVSATIPVGSNPIAFGIFIQPKLFAGTPGSPNCSSVSVSALAHKYGSLAKAAQALKVSVPALQQSIATFCA
jgi:YVTN family beta-propeller protein